MRRLHPARSPTARTHTARHRTANSGPLSKSSTPSITAKTLQETWQSSQAEIGAAINAYGTSITTGPERLVRFAAEGYTGDADAAMTNVIDLITKIDHAGGLLDVIDKLKTFHTSLQRLNDLPTSWLDGHGDVQLANTCLIYRTRKEAFETATTELERYEQVAMIVRKRDPGTTINWDNFQDLCTVLQGPKLPWARPSNLAAVLHQFSPTQRTQLLRGVPTGVIEAERHELDPLTLAEGKLYDFV